MSSMAGTGRIASMDQFRGYTVAGMFVVNFLGAFAVIHSVLKHNNTYFSYADSIMPSFLFACGFSYRLSLLRRLDQVGPSLAYRRILWRSLGLVLISLVVYGVGFSFKSWDEMTGQGVLRALAELLKADAWEVLAIIGVCQLLILPVVARSAWTRFGTMIGFSAAHFLMSYSFNYDFVSGQPNWMDDLWGTSGRRAWDGGFFGLLHWSVPMLAGTLAFDIINAAGRSRGSAAARMIAWGTLIMIVAYALSCFSTLYTADDRRTRENGEPIDIANSPVIPPLDRLADRSPANLLATAPLVEPEVPAKNYWMMDKRIVTIPFIWFSTGFALALYGLFVIACDRFGASLELFRLLGMNPLAAYIIHGIVERTVYAFVPRDSPLWWTMVGLVIFFAITLVFVRFLDRQKIYLRL
ncbi:heparan-alpha-glucosaminide N-acetyltransferase domain-containing protein [Tautonia marina]|uniref:heparan-alpha-glucosaminide N-acetyltransferase domain-containing protein n=1 Tax=Tautonia marina TaxID=2653855 RepID=UPI0012613505|nr:heparan-alpha-glucosaminide N-acetyltransferase domain-containing protein [Tautonia marina]